MALRMKQPRPMPRSGSPGGGAASKKSAPIITVRSSTAPACTTPRMPTIDDVTWAPSMTLPSQRMDSYTLHWVILLPGRNRGRLKMG